MKSNVHREWIAWLLASLLVGSQALLLLHSIAPPAGSHAADCQLCVHGSGLESALPKPIIIVHVPVINEPAATLESLVASLNVYYGPTARGPPRTSSA